MHMLLFAAHPAKGILAVRRLTQRDVAAGIGCNPTYLCSVLNGERRASAAFQSRLAQYLGLPASELFVDPATEPDT